LTIGRRFAEIFAYAVRRQTQILLGSTEIIWLVADLDTGQAGTEYLLRDTSLIGHTGRFEVTEVDTQQHTPVCCDQQLT
jgi:hypothetical protein